MRIALITETFLPDVNGVVTTLCRLLEHIHAHGHQALVFAPEGAPASYAGADIVPLRGVPLPLYPDVRLTPPQPGVLARLGAFRPDVLHCAGLAALGPLGHYATRRLRVPAVAAYHTDFPAYSTHYGLGFARRASYAYLRWFHNACALTLCPSSATLADLRVNGFRRLRLWGRGVDTDQFHPAHRDAAWRTAVGAAEGDMVLLYVGRLAAEKRLDLLADAVRNMPGIRLVMVGDGPARASLMQRMAGLPVTFAGFQTGQHLARAYASADAFVFPSDTETFGQVVQEAMASGLPVVAARAGGALDLVRDGATGLLFAPGDAAALRAQIQALRANAPLRRQMGIAGRARAERRSWPSVCDELLHHYHLLSDRRHGQEAVQSLSQVA